jgi:hypothetical protein
VPSSTGAHNFHAMAFNPATQLVYIPVIDTAERMTIDRTELVGGAHYDLYFQDEKWPAWGSLTAWDPVAQKARWVVKHELPVNGGIISTGGNLVFQGTAMGKLEAYTADTGWLLWSADTGAAVQAAPTTVQLDGEQYILVASGNGESSFFGTMLPRYSNAERALGPPRLLAFKLGGTAQLPQQERLAFPKPPLPPFPAEVASKGESLFAQLGCEACHGVQVEHVGGTIPDLRRATAETHAVFGRILHEGCTGQPACRRSRTYPRRACRRCRPT